MVFWFSGNRCSVLLSHATCHSNKRLELYVNHDCVFANASLHCYSVFELWELSDFLSLFTAVHDCDLNLPLNERQCLVQVKQGVSAIKSHDI